MRLGSFDQMLNVLWLFNSCFVWLQIIYLQLDQYEGNALVFRLTLMTST